MTATKLTPGERRAWRAGFKSGVDHAVRQLELFSIKFACRGTGIDAPTSWPEVTRGVQRPA